MKVPVLIFLLNTCLHALTVHAQIPSSFLGEWEGKGTLMGNTAEFSMKWEQVLNDQFYKLTFTNSIPSVSFSMNAHAYYKVTDDEVISGYWFDSRGILFPLSGNVEDSTITIYWGTPEIEQGRTEYVLISQSEVKVNDFVLKNGEFSKFAEADYEKKKIFTVNMLKGFTLASPDIEASKDFYENVFGVTFETKEMFDAQLFEGEWLGVTMLICPADVAKNSAKQNRHQFEIEVNDIDDVIAKVQKHGGTLMHEIIEEEGVRRVGIYDPDKNSMILIERKYEN